MLNEKMLGIINYVESCVAEREELIHYIALALLTKRNLFVLGDPGQSKSDVINRFQQQIEGARKFKTNMSKKTDEEHLFGRLDLASIIPGNVSRSILDQDPTYQQLKGALTNLLDNYRADPSDKGALDKANGIQQEMEQLRKCLAELYGNSPEYINTNKIPDSHICFLDEIFKSNEALLDSLLAALNEREYTNEGVTVKIPVISFFSASNEIPNFSNPEEKGLKALYDRFDFKFKTEYVKEKENRLDILQKKQGRVPPMPTPVGITLEELAQMQAEVLTVEIPASINELMDNILCGLRKKDIHVSDRTYFNFSPIVQAEAWLRGADKVSANDMKILTNYLWNKPEEKSIVENIIRELAENPLGDQINAILVDAYTCRDTFNAAADKNRALLQLKQGLIAAYGKASALKDGLAPDDATRAAVDRLIDSLEDVSRAAFGQTSYTYVSLDQMALFQRAG